MHTHLTSHRCIISVYILLIYAVYIGTGREVDRAKKLLHIRLERLEPRSDTIHIHETTTSHGSGGSGGIGSGGGSRGSGGSEEERVEKINPTTTATTTAVNTSAASNTTSRNVSNLPYTTTHTTAAATTTTPRVYTHTEDVYHNINNKNNKKRS